MIPLYRPMKKKGGTLAGIPRASGERNSPTSNGAFSHNQVCYFLIYYPLTHPRLPMTHSSHDTIVVNAVPVPPPRALGLAY
jgi:hypothetical protein